MSLFQADDLCRRSRRLIVFDMDSTLVHCKLIGELARTAGVGDQVARIIVAAMRGDVPLDKSFRRRLATLRGLDASVLETNAANCRPPRVRSD